MTFFMAVTAALALSASPLHASAVPDIRVIRTVPGRPVPHFVRLRYDAVVDGIRGTDEFLVDTEGGRFVEVTDAGPAGGRQGFDGAGAWLSDSTGLGEPADQADDRSAVLAWSLLLGRTPRAAPRVTALVSRSRDRRARLRYPELTRAVDVRIDPQTGRLVAAELRAQSNHATLTIDAYRRSGDIVVPARFRVHSDFGDTTATLRAVDLPRTVPRGAFALPPPPNDTTLDGITSVPFALRRDGPVVTIRIDDGPPLRMLVDTGSSFTLSLPAAERLGLRIVGRATTGGVGPDLVPVWFAFAERVRIGRAVLRDQPLEIMTLHDLADGARTDGLIGYELFARLAARFDFSHRRLQLARRVSLLHPRGKRIPIVLETGQPQADGEVDGLRGGITIDTGSAYGLDVMAPTVREHDLVRRYGATELESSRGIGGTLSDYRARARTVRLGAAVAHDVPIALDVATAGAFADPSVIGNAGIPLLQRFVMVLDYRGRAMYLDPVR